MSSLCSLALHGGNLECQFRLEASTDAPLANGRYTYRLPAMPRCTDHSGSRSSEIEGLDVLGQRYRRCAGGTIPSIRCIDRLSPHGFERHRIVPVRARHRDCQWTTLGVYDKAPLAAKLASTRCVRACFLPPFRLNPAPPPSPRSPPWRGPPPAPTLPPPSWRC